MINNTEVYNEEEALLPERVLTDDLELLLAALPLPIRQSLEGVDSRDDLLEIVLDLGRKPEARYRSREVYLSDREVTEADIDYVVSRIGTFGSDNRAGIERTLHRISCIRNRAGRIVGLTLRIGRAVFGTINIIKDLVESGQSILLLGRPGVGKTTLLRETARVLADDLHKRVVIVDTSNEIAGDGDIPHPAIGRARRMQVARPELQHQVMIEGVENHMPEVIVIDEIGTQLEAEAARTIAERGVQLIGTAHGQTLENLMLNPTLSDLIGGIQTVTLGDEEARRRGTQKSVLERKAPPTFDVLVEIRDRDRVAVHLNVADTVDAILRGQQFTTQIRYRNERGEIEVYEEQESESTEEQHQSFEEASMMAFGYSPRNGYGGPQSHRNGNGATNVVSSTPRRNPAQPATPNSPGNPNRKTMHKISSGANRTVNEPEVVQISPPAPTSRFSKEKTMPVSTAKPLRIYPHGVNRTRLESVIKHMHLPADIVREIDDADMVLTLKNYYKQKPLSLRQAESSHTPIYILKSNTVAQMESALADVFNIDPPVSAPAETEGAMDLDSDPVKSAIYQTEEAISKVMEGGQAIELPPQNSFIRRLQHQMAERYNLVSQSKGREPFRRVRIYPNV
jgi:stage III sporulation protein SpoIIIAA